MKWRKKREPGVPATVQLRAVSRQPFGALESYVPLHNGEIALYRAVREAVPIVDAALMKIIRLVGGFVVRCPERTVQEELAHFCGRCRWAARSGGWIIFWSSIWIPC